MPLCWRKEASAGGESFHVYMDVSKNQKPSAHLQRAFPEMLMWKQLVQLRVKFWAFREPSHCNTGHNLAIDCCCVLTLIFTCLIISIHVQTIQMEMQMEVPSQFKNGLTLAAFQHCFCKWEKVSLPAKYFYGCLLRTEKQPVNKHCQGVSTSTGQAVCSVHHLKLSWEQLLGFKLI